MTRKPKDLLTTVGAGVGALLVAGAAASGLFLVRSAAVGPKTDPQVVAGLQYEAAYAEVKDATQQVQISAAAWRKEEPDDPLADEEVRAAEAYCQETVQWYAMLAQQWSPSLRPPELPAQIDPTDPSTDCKDHSK